MFLLLLSIVTLVKPSFAKANDKTKYEHNNVRKGGLNAPVSHMTNSKVSNGTISANGVQIKYNIDQGYVKNKGTLTVKNKAHLRIDMKEPPVRLDTTGPPTTTELPPFTNIQGVRLRKIASVTAAPKTQKSIDININQHVVVRMGSACCLYNLKHSSKPTNCFICKEKKKITRGDLKKILEARNPKCICRRGFIAEPDEGSEVPEHDMFNSVVDQLILTDALMELHGLPNNSTTGTNWGTKLCDLIENPDSLFCKLVKELDESEDRTLNKKKSRTFE